MFERPLRIRIACLIAMGLVPASHAAYGQNDLLGVYAHVRFAVKAVGYEEPTVLGEVSRIPLRVSLTSEEGSRDVLLPASIGDWATVTVSRDGRPLPPGAVEISWGEKREKYDLYGVDPRVDVRDTERLEPGTGVHAPMELKTLDGQPFEDGLYTVLLVVDPHKVTFADGSPFTGRGGRGGGRFRVLRAISEADRAAALNQDGTWHLREGRHEQALDAFRELVERMPDSQWAWDRLGLAYAEVGDHRSALDCFEKLGGSSLRNDRSIVPYKAAYAYVALGDEAQAAQILRYLVAEGEVEQEVAKMRRQVVGEPEPGSDVQR